MCYTGRELGKWEQAYYKTQTRRPGSDSVHDSAGAEIAKGGY
jgi:hypothetical protein